MKGKVTQVRNVPAAAELCSLAAAAATAAVRLLFKLPDGGKVSTAPLPGAGGVMAPACM